ncbi:hypothetical protein OAN94_00755 [Verrucomicrobiales bacterium]|nr:hypothetical protein [Verrucomicrobiales bacterium]MDC0502779.1 hypothetical protein [Verrucomicrobiales bacterium]MDF1787444.1 hypothetical protein [Verrucomicrobiales bacterium]
MKTEILARHFDRKSTRFKQARPASPRFFWGREQKDYALDVKQDRPGEYFERDGGKFESYPEYHIFTN